MKTHLHWLNWNYGDANTHIPSHECCNLFIFLLCIISKCPTHTAMCKVLLYIVKTQNCVVFFLLMIPQLACFTSAHAYSVWAQQQESIICYFPGMDLHCWACRRLTHSTSLWKYDLFTSVFSSRCLILSVTCTQQCNVFFWDRLLRLVRFFIHFIFQFLFFFFYIFYLFLYP